MILSKTTTTQIEPKNWILFSKSLYIQNTPQLFLMVSIPTKERYMGVPNSHKCKPSIDEIPSQKSNRWETFHLVAGLEVTFLGAELRYQARCSLKTSISVACYRPFLVPVSSISSHYQCCYLLSLIMMSLS